MFNRQNSKLGTIAKRRQHRFGQVFLCVVNQIETPRQWRYLHKQHKPFAYWVKQHQALLELLNNPHLTTAEQLTQAKEEIQRKITDGD